MSPMQKYLTLFLGGLFISLLLTIIFFKVTLAAQNSSLVSPAATSNSKANIVELKDDLAPSLSLKGKVATHSGEILWQSRVVTEAADPVLPAQIQQGEQLKTGDDGLVFVDFPDISRLIISPKSQVNFAQTLPINLVYVQTVGMVEYVKPSDLPISIRALHLLINQDQGDILVNVDTDTNTVVVDVKKGEITLAFNDTDNISNLVTLTAGKKYIFDDDTRTAITRILK